jgi:membrane protease YdiL (CAAX protease family)
MVENQVKPPARRWGTAEIIGVIWIGLALIVLVPITLFLHGSIPFFTVIWLIDPLFNVIHTVDAHQVGIRGITWQKFISTTAINLLLLLLVSVFVEPWSHTYQALVNSALSNRPPDTTFAWLINFTGFRAWSGLILYSGFVTMFGEELFFRGWLLQSLQRRMNTKLAIVVQAALFTVPQVLVVLLLAPLQGAIYTVIYSWLAIGVIGGWAAARTKSIWPSLASATIWNAILVAAVLWMGGVNANIPTPAVNRFYINNGNLLDANGNKFIMRGINEPYAWFPAQTNAFADIKATGANTVRVVLSGGRWTKSTAWNVANIIQLCKDNRLICVLDDHDTLGYGEDGEAHSLSQAVSYWKEIQKVLIGQEAYVIINIGNEPYGNVNASTWVNDTKNAILEMRKAGFHHTLMVDAPSWGQDRQFYMRDNAANIFESDPDQNIIFSVHMYEFFNTASKVENYLSSFVSRGLPVVIGEFGWETSYGDPDEEAIMSYAQAYGIGYLAWSWSGNSEGGDCLDMVTNFNSNQVTDWGMLIINGANGLQQTSKEASIYAITVPKGTPSSSIPFWLRWRGWHSIQHSLSFNFDSMEDI